MVTGKEIGETNRTMNALALSLLLSACGTVTSPVHRHDFGNLGRFEFRVAEPAMKGIVVGAPHSGSAVVSSILARAVSDRTGAGLVAAYGFKSKRIAVAQPLVVRTSSYQIVPGNAARPGSVFREFKEILHDIAEGEIDLYIEFRGRPATGRKDNLQVVASGFTFEESRIIKQSYLEIRDRVIAGRAAPALSLSMSPLEEIGWNATGIRHHGVLLVVKRGLSLRIPEKFFDGANTEIYGDIFAAWVKDIVRLASRNTGDIPKIAVTLVDLGRFDAIPRRNNAAGVVMGAPHGSFDAYTAEMVKQLSYRTGFPAVIAKGFTPTETEGWRINVNRPSEKTYPESEFDFEFTTGRSKEVYQTYKRLILEAVEDDLELYFDVHQYGRGHTLQVATVGVSLEQARDIKAAYEEIRDRFLASDHRVAAVELIIEPMDDLEIGAWPAKANGILRVARKSLHFELPLHSMLRTPSSRNIYVKILAELFIYTSDRMRR